MNQFNNHTYENKYKPDDLVLGLDLSKQEDSKSSTEKTFEELGMVSAGTQSRKEYIKETENFISKLKHLNMNCEEAAQESEIAGNGDQNRNASNPFTISFIEKEKENKSLDGLHILTMNSKFITGFNMGYSLPLNDLIDKSKRKIYKYSNIFHRRERRSHPYNDGNIVKVVEKIVSNKSDDGIIEVDPSSYRLRTTSLSSGAGNSRKVTVEQCETRRRNSVGLQRSRSMEVLKGSEDSSDVVDEKAKDIETVSQGIQKMQVEDCTREMTL